MIVAGYTIYFLSIAVLGLAGLLAMHFIGHFAEADHDIDHDIDDAGEFGSRTSFLSFRVLLLFVTGFGVGGFALAQNGTGVLGTMIAASIGAIAMSGAGYVVLDFFHRSQANSVLTAAALVGSFATVVTTIPYDGIGEVTVIYNGASQWYNAKAAGSLSIKRGTTVRITGTMGAALVVEPK